MAIHVRVLQNGRPGSKREFYVHTVGQYNHYDVANAARKHLTDQGHKVLDNLDILITEDLPHEYVCPNCKGKLNHQKVMVNQQTTGVWQKLYSCEQCKLFEKEYEFELFQTERI
jgi:hypothetical protein